MRMNPWAEVKKSQLLREEACVESGQENYCNRTGIRPGIDKQLLSIKGKVAISRKITIAEL